MINLDGAKKLLAGLLLASNIAFATPSTSPQVTAYLNDQAQIHNIDADVAQEAVTYIVNNLAEPCPQQQQELDTIFEQATEKTSTSIAQRFGHLFEAENPQEYIDNRLRTVESGHSPFSVDPTVKEVGAAVFKPIKPITMDGQEIQPDGRIVFGSMEIAQDEWTQVHELIHKLTFEQIDDNTFRTGFNTHTRDAHGYITGQGRGLNEGATDLLTESVMGHPAQGGRYHNEVFIARQLAEVVGEDVFFKAKFKDPRILINEIGARHYNGIVRSLDEYNRHNGILWNKLNGRENPQEFENTVRELAASDVRTGTITTGGMDTLTEEQRLARSATARENHLEIAQQSILNVIEEQAIKQSMQSGMTGPEAQQVANKKLIEHSERMLQDQTIPEASRRVFEQTLQRFQQQEKTQGAEMGKP